MNFELSEEQELIRRTAREIAEGELADNAFTWEGEYPLENANVLANAGLLGISLPEKYGGGGYGPVEVLIAQEEIGRVCPDSAHLVSHSAMGAARPISYLGNDTLQDKYLPDICAGESVLSVAISEPQAGSAANQIETRARSDDGTVVIDGQKTWVSNGDIADAFLIYARFPEGIGAVIVDRDAAGFEVSETYTNMYGGTQAELRLKDCRIDPGQVLVRGKDGFKRLLETFNIERLHNGMMCVSLARNAFERALDHAQSREQFGQPIGDFQAIQHKLADMVISIEAARLLILQAASTYGRNIGLPDRLQTSIAKVFANEMAQRVVNQSLQIHGANGYIRDHPIEYLYRYIRGTSIAGGTVEVHRNGITDALYRSGYEPY